MSLSTENEIVSPEECADYLPVEIDERVREIVTFFYPGQAPQVALMPEHIEVFMDCSTDAAYDLARSVGQFSGRRMGLFGILMVDFCDYLEIDEMWVQLFLVSLRKTNPSLFYGKTTSILPKGERPRTVQEMIEYLNHNGPEGREIIKMRAQQWRLDNPNGEMMCKRDGKYRVMIYTDEATQILGWHLRTVQEAFKVIREELGMRPRSPLSIKIFSKHFHIDERDVRISLSIMYGEEYDPNAY